MAITIYFEPKVTLIARQEYVGAPHIKWESDSDVPAEQVAEFSGRLCYLSYGEDCGIQDHKTIRGRSTNYEYLANIIATKHGSVTEHAVWTLLLEGVSRSLTHELVRHRHFSVSQLSQRYADESQTGFVVPPEVLDEGVKSDAYTTWFQSCKTSLAYYRKLLEAAETKLADQGITGTVAKKRARQTARSVLPNCTETKIVVTGNARSWRHFLVLRGVEAADREIRRLAVNVASLLKKESPNLFQDVEIVEGNDGLPKVEVLNGTI